MKSVFVCLVMLAASVPGFAAVTVLENFNTVATEDLIIYDSQVINEMCQMGVSGSVNARVGIFLQDREISFGELLSGEVKINKIDSSVAKPYFIFLVDTNRNGAVDMSGTNKDKYLMQMNPTYSEPDDNGWSKLIFDLNSTFGISSSLNTPPTVGKSLSLWLDEYGESHIYRYLVAYNLSAGNTLGCYVDDLQFKYGTPDPEPDPEEPVPATVPVPGAVVLASLGLGIVRYMRGRRGI
jgi:hypothetical protein